MKCRHYKFAPLIPFRGRKYAYCEIKDGPNVKSLLDELMIREYCDSENKQDAYEACPYWRLHYDTTWEKFLKDNENVVARLTKKLKDDD